MTPKITAEKAAAVGPQGILAGAFLMILGSFTLMDPITVASAEATKPRAGHDSNLRLAPGVEWPTDKRTVSRLQDVADEYGKPLIIVSGKRELGNRNNPAPGTQWYFWKQYQNGTGNLAAYPNPNAPHVVGYAADVNVVNADGSTSSIGLDPRGRKLLNKHDLVLAVQSEAWHVEPEEFNDWRYWQKP